MEEPTKKVKRSRWGKKKTEDKNEGEEEDQVEENDMNDPEAKQKALEAIAKLNALLGDGGEVKPTPTEMVERTHTPFPDECVERVGINHLSGPKRFLLTRKETLDECLENFGVHVYVKGVYYSVDAEPDDSAEPLYLSLHGPTLSSVNGCVKYLRDLQTSEDAGGAHSCKVFIGIPATSPFNVVSKIIGPGGEFVKHIKKQANCNVLIAGKDCGVNPHLGNDEELHIRLEAHSAEGLVKARELTADLIDHIKLQYQEWQQSQAKFAYPVYPPINTNYGAIPQPGLNPALMVPQVPGMYVPQSYMTAPPLQQNILAPPPPPSSSSFHGRLPQQQQQPPPPPPPQSKPPPPPPPRAN